MSIVTHLLIFNWTVVSGVRHWNENTLDRYAFCLASPKKKSPVIQYTFISKMRKQGSKHTLSLARASSMRFMKEFYWCSIPSSSQKPWSNNKQEYLKSPLWGQQRSPLSLGRFLGNHSWFGIKERGGNVYEDSQRLQLSIKSVKGGAGGPGM